MVLTKFLPTKEMLLGKRDKLKNYVDYTKFDYKAKINKYTEAAEYISEISNNVYLHTIYDVLIENIFSDNVNFEVLQKYIWLLEYWQLSLLMVDIVRNI